MKILFKKLFFLFTYFFGLSAIAQYNLNSTKNIAADSIAEENTIEISNPEILRPFFDQLRNLETKKTGKIRIVQIGDSHIQADFSSNLIKDVLQNKFGNGGLGFVFPHKLAKTNGSRSLNFNSNANFSSSRNVRPANDSPIGISGYTLSTNEENAVIEVVIKNSQDFGNSMQILTPNNQKFFDLSFTENKISSVSKKTQSPKTYKVKKGETLFSIAQKNKISVAELKRLNNLKSDKLAVGKTLNIGEIEQVQIPIEVPEFEKVELTKTTYSHFYESENTIKKFYLISNNQFSENQLSGLVLENNSAGITFSGIGVNGAKYSDYNKFPMFFEQLKSLQPNLLIVSLGTNESFDRLDVSEYIQNVNKFVSNVKVINPNTAILITTPPPSTLHKKYENTFIADYTQALIETSNKTQAFAVYNLYEALGAENGVQLNKQRNFLAKDEVHYTKEGYETQGVLLVNALLQAYQNYNSNK